MKFGKILILGGAALAGSLFYKIQHDIKDDSSASPSSGGIYSTLTGPGSLGRLLHDQSEARDATLTTEDSTKPVFTNKSGGSLGLSAIPSLTGDTKQAGGIGKVTSSKRLTQSGVVEEAPNDDLALIDAAAKGDREKVEKRIAARTKIDSRDSLRRTPLMYASWNGYNDICSLLIAAGANPEFKDREGNNVFDYAAGRGLGDTLHFLFERTHKTDDQHYMEYATLIKAVFAGDAAKLPPETDKLLSINRINAEGQAPLHIAAGNGSVDLMKALLLRGAQVNIENSGHQTPLHWAAWNNQTAAVELLLSKGADVRKVDLGGNTPLILAAQNGNSDTVKILLQHGADKYFANKQGKTASIIAEDKGFKEVANLLK